MLEVSNVALPLDAGLPGPAADELVRSAAAGALGVEEAALVQVRLLKRSVDARRKKEVHFVATLGVEFFSMAVECESLVRAQERGGTGALAGTSVKRHEAYKPLIIPANGRGSKECRPIVVGAGPAGLFAALYLARAGLRPLVLERGGEVDERLAAVGRFEAGGALDPQMNIQFGEGGAGTFSDGKLTTNARNPFARHVLHWLVEAGAPEEIIWQAKPHIGTDLLVEVVRTLRQQIIEAGGEVRFHTCAESFRFRDGLLAGVDIVDTRTLVEEYISTQHLVLACGHSARDTFEAVRNAGALLQQKPFSVGVRIEHNQEMLNRAQYGEAANHPALGAADYKFAVHLPGGRSVYTFCMCPGGEVVCAASEPEGVVVNGMSRFARDGCNANSALLVGVNPGDFGSDDPLAGVELQRKMEHMAYQSAMAAGGIPYAAPVQTVGDFLLLEQETRPIKVKLTTKGPAVEPTYARGVVWCNLHDCLPSFVSDALAQALPLLERKLRGFSDANAVMTGVETRSSSPVRIVRDENLQAYIEESDAPLPRVAGGSGFYPCGEGAGYAGGIMSAAADGLRIAQAVAQSYGKHA